MIEYIKYLYNYFIGWHKGYYVSLPWSYTGFNNRQTWSNAAKHKIHENDGYTNTLIPICSINSSPYRDVALDSIEYKKALKTGAEFIVLKVKSTSFRSDKPYSIKQSKA